MLHNKVVLCSISRTLTLKGTMKKEKLSHQKLVLDNIIDFICCANTSLTEHEFDSFNYNASVLEDARKAKNAKRN